MIHREATGDRPLARRDARDRFRTDLPPVARRSTWFRVALSLSGRTRIQVRSHAAGARRVSGGQVRWGSRGFERLFASLLKKGLHCEESVPPVPVP
jgi:hypothetical protein